jgi:hypothetical protein
VSLPLHDDEEPEVVEKMVVVQPRGHDVYARRGRRGCPPHGPLLVEGVGGGSPVARYVARCLACGLVGPEREDVMEAKRTLQRHSPKSA